MAAVALFGACARERRADFVHSAKNARAVAQICAGLACIALQVGPAGDPQRATRLLGATLTLGAGGWTPMRIEPDRTERVREAARAALGEEAFATAMAEGQALPLEEAVGLALESAEVVVHRE